MAWERVKTTTTRRSESEEMNLRIKMVKARRRRNQDMKVMQGVFSPKAFRALVALSGGDPLDEKAAFRVGLFRDPTNQTHFAVGIDPEGALCRAESRQFSAARFMPVFGTHLRGGGYRLPLTLVDEALVFQWPPDDMRTVLIPEAGRE
jgi:hypothetical protein